MKKLIILIAASVIAAVSCQKTIIPGFEQQPDINSAPGKLTATIEKTKVTYSETSSFNLQPAWEVGDKIIGFDDAGNTYTLTVSSVSGDTATLSGTVPDGTLHLIYKCSAKASDIVNNTLAIDYTAQKGDKTMPAVMLADGTVTDGTCDFTFTNAGAIIGISAVKGVPSGAAITKVTIEGENLSAATVALSGSALALTTKIKSDDSISTATLNGITVTDANGTLSTPIFIAVPAGAKIKKVSFPVTKDPETITIPSTAADKEGVDYVTIAGKKWAKWNIGANSATDYGWYFPWAGTEGYIRYANTWQSVNSTAFEFTYSPSSAHTVNASDYVYVKTQKFAITGYRFWRIFTPYHTDINSIETGWTKYIPTGKSSYWSGTGSPDNKTTLDLEDDAAHVNWGGSWRMPTRSDFISLINATFWARDEISGGYYVFAPDASHIAGNYVTSFPADLSKSDALLFFPAAGYGNDSGYMDEGEDGRYWSSSLGTSMPSYASFLYLNDLQPTPQQIGIRQLGYSVRPISD